MQTIYIATGTIRTIESAIYGNDASTEERRPFFHLVQASTDSEAESKVYEHYEKKNEARFSSGPYGTQYHVDRVEVFEQIGELNII